MSEVLRGRRTTARLAAVQGLYQLDVAGATTDVVLADVLTVGWRGGEADRDEASLPPPDTALLRILVEGAAGDKANLDPAIDDALSRCWGIGNLEALLRAILRAGAFELRHMPDVPTRVVINEYVNVAHAFFSGREPGLVNAVLDRLARTWRGGDALPGSDDSAPLDGDASGNGR